MEKDDLLDTSSPFARYVHKEQLDVLVCGYCDLVFHNVGEFQQHREGEIERVAVLNFLSWKYSLPGNSQRDENNDWILFNQWRELQISTNKKDLNRVKTTGINISNVDTNRLISKMQNTLISTNNSPKDIQLYSNVNKKDKIDPELKSQKSNLSKDSNVFLKQSNTKIKSVEKPPTPVKKRLLAESPKNSSPNSTKVEGCPSWTSDVEQLSLMSSSDSMAD